MVSSFAYSNRASFADSFLLFSLDQKLARSVN
jgi:hypothetical protein